MEILVLYYLEISFINSNIPQVYSTIGLNNVKVFMDNTGKYWFIGKEIGLMLGYSDIKQAIKSHVLECNKIIINTNTIPGVRGQFYPLILLVEILIRCLLQNKVYMNLLVF